MMLLAGIALLITHSGGGEGEGEGPACLWCTPPPANQCSYDVSSLQLPNGLGRGEGRVMRPPKHDPPSCAAS
ncbi:hypothetical protein J4Q44_G00073810 [Coregonus suidteri]|uniref:Secreted protein n=1 Tax=Coregonus suidteri TaxID=861788 RepID=A0AAN8M4Q1_9TELE